MDSPDAPTPPDPRKTANAQFGFTKDTLNYLSGLNAPNINGPNGSVTYSHGRNGEVTGQNISLDPALAGLRNGLLGMAGGKLGQMSNSPFNLEDVGVHVPGTDDYSGYGDKVAHASFDKARGLLDPVFQQQNRDLSQSLADRGQPMTSEGAGLETGRLADAHNRAYTDAANNAVLESGQEMSRLSGIQNQDFNTALGAKLTERGLPMQEFGGLLNSSNQIQGPQQPGIATLNAAPPDYQGAVGQQYSGLLNNYNQQMQQNNAIWGALGSLGGSLGKAAFI